MFKQQGAGAYIPTKSVIVKPEAQVDLNPVTLNQTRFLIPQYLGFIDPKGTTLNYNIKMSGRGRPVPNGRAGVHSLWRDFRLNLRSALGSCHRRSLKLSANTIK